MILIFLLNHSYMLTESETRNDRRPFENEQLFKTNADLSLKAFFNDSNSIIVLFNKYLEITAFNKQAQKYATCLFDTDLVVGENASQILPEVFKPRFTEYALTALNGYETKNMVINIPDTSIWWSFRFSPLFTNCEEIFGISITANDISERKKTEDLLKISESRFKSLTESGTDMISLYDEDFKTIYRSAAAFQLTGRHDDILDKNQSVLEFLHPDDYIRLQSTIKNLVATKGLKIHDIFRWRHIDGHYLWLEGSLTNRLHDVNIRAIVSNMRNISEEIKLRENQSLLASIINSTNDAVISCDMIGKITSWNKSAEILLGFKEEDVIGDDFKLFIPSNIVSQEDALIKKSRKGVFFNQIQSKRIKKNGEIIDVSLTMSPILNAKNKVIGISKIIRDVTQLNKTKTELELFKLIIEKTSDAIMITDAGEMSLDGPRIIYVNKSFTTTTGYTAEDVLGKNPRIMQGPLTSRKELDKLNSSIKNWLPNEVEIVNYKKNGDPFWVNISMVPITNEIGWYTHWVSIQKDVSMRRREMEERELLIKELSNNNKELKQFSYITSHNLRGPLTNLMGIIQLLKLETISDPKTRSLIEAFKSSTISLKATLDDLIKILIIKENNNQELATLNLETHLNKVISSIGNIIKASQATIDYDFKEANSVQFNSAYLESIFLNLITNAIKYGKPGLIPHIKIKSTIKNDCIQLSFSDNGLGMAWEKVKDKIFGLYQRFHRHADSKGIGLYLVHSQITSLGGSIEVETEPNKGTTFIINFAAEIIKA